MANKHKIKEIIRKIKEGYPYKLSSAYFDKTEIGSYCYYYSETNKCFQFGIWCYEANVMLLDYDPERITENELFQKLQKHFLDKKIE